MNKEELDKIGAEVLDASIAVHSELGAGLLESAYTLALMKELQLRNLNVLKGVPVELEYKGTQLGKAYVIDLLIENEIILEIKSVEKIEPIFISQLITYLKLRDNKLGYLINFNVPLLKHGFRRIVNKIDDETT